MGLKGITTKVFTCYRRQRKDGSFPIKLKVTYKGESYEYKLNLYVTGEEDKQLALGKFGRNDHLKKINSQMIAYLSHANAIIDRMAQFNRMSFEKEFLGNSFNSGSESTKDIIKLLNQKSLILYEKGSISYSDSFKTTANSLEAYSKRIPLDDLNTEVLTSYETYLLNKGNSSGCVGVYMRNIRTVFNEAIENGLVSKDQYPFGRKKILYTATEKQ